MSYLPGLLTRLLTVFTRLLTVLLVPFTRATEPILAKVCQNVTFLVKQSKRD